MLRFGIDGRARASDESIRPRRILQSDPKLATRPQRSARILKTFLRATTFAIQAKSFAISPRISDTPRLYQHTVLTKLHALFPAVWPKGPPFWEVQPNYSQSRDDRRLTRLANSPALETQSIRGKTGAACGIREPTALGLLSLCSIKIEQRLGNLGSDRGVSRLTSGSGLTGLLTIVALDITTLNAMIAAPTTIRSGFLRNYARECGEVKVGFIEPMLAFAITKLAQSGPAGSTNSNFDGYRAVRPQGARGSISSRFGLILRSLALSRSRRC